MIYRGGGGPNPPSLTPFVSIVVAPNVAINTMPVFVNGGLVYRGLIPGRANDVAGFAVIYGGFSSDLRQSERLQRRVGVAAAMSWCSNGRTPSRWRAGSPCSPTYSTSSGRGA